METNKHLIIDFDSTFVKVEALDELSKIALEGNEKKERIVQEIENITNLGMEGRITFPESLQKRLALFKPNKRQIEELVCLLKKEISTSFLSNKDFFKENANSIWIISGGFEDYICPVVCDFGIEDSHVLANKFVFDSKGEISGFDASRFLAKDDGKVEAVKSLGLDPNEIVVVGDGYTDFRIKETGCATKFCVFCENVRREAVAEKADLEVVRIDDLISVI